MGWFVVVAPLPRRLPWEGSTTERSTTSVTPLPGTSPGKGQPHLPITCDITKGRKSAKVYKGCLPQWCESVLAMQAAAFTGFSWSQLTSQQHLPSTFSLIRVQSQRSFSFSICIAQCPATSFYAKRPNCRAVVQRSSSFKDVSDHEAHPQQRTVPQLYATRRGNRTYPTRERKRPWWIVSAVYCVWRGSNLSSSPLNRIETHRRPRASAPIAVSSTVDRTATVQQRIDGSPRSIAERLRRVICPPPPHPPPAANADISLPSQTPSAATAEREGTYVQPAARANR